MLSPTIKFQIKEAALTSLFKEEKNSIEYHRISKYIANILNFCYTSDDIRSLLPEELQFVLKQQVAYFSKEILTKPEVITFLENPRNKETLCLIQQQKTRNLLLGN